ncbi:unnamed protein product [Lactuca virosa]|uniref:Ubiquitin-like protease family profile domain-containing protein n=1 Tax=Lactuca virosa TaxID=75947 RepID=A0AAU9N2B3_9ASTR|nr:unnamed protein product [Lactuca virosa]
MVDGPHWKEIDWVLIPINIPQLHWYLADLDLLTWKKSTEVKFVKAKHVPQQEQVEEGERGDCGVFVCMFMEMLASGVPVETRQSPRDTGFTYRNRMAEIIWNSRI